MKKLNHIWVFSDSIKGHEIQSLALANKLAHKTNLFHCGLRQPWLSFAPRILPGFGKNIIWQKNAPDISQIPDAIMTCGRRMAAVGKFYKNLTKCKHIQILNPTDNLNKYDIVICPEHDRLIAPNVIKSKGSLHNINESLLQNLHQSSDKRTLSLLIGNPGKEFFNNLKSLNKKILVKYPEFKLVVCGSRRTNQMYFRLIRQVFSNAHMCWLDESDGPNPYLQNLANSDVIMVTADSINMVSEACATDKTVITLAKKSISPKHKRFLSSLEERLSNFGTTHSVPVPLDTLTHVAQKVLLKIKE